MEFCCSTVTKWFTCSVFLDVLYLCSTNVCKTEKWWKGATVCISFFNVCVCVYVCLLRAWGVSLQWLLGKVNNDELFRWWWWSALPSFTTSIYHHFNRTSPLPHLLPPSVCLFSSLTFRMEGRGMEEQKRCLKKDKYDSGWTGLHIYYIDTANTELCVSQGLLA